MLSSKRLQFIKDFFFLCMYLFACVSIGFADSLRPSSDDFWEQLTTPSEYQELFLTVHLNEVDQAYIGMFLQNTQGKLWIEQDALKNWHLKPFNMQPLVYNEQKYILLSDLPGASYKINNADQTINIVLPPDLFEASQIDLLSKRYVTPTPSSPSGFINYDFYGFYTPTQKITGNALFELGYTNSYGVGITNIMVKDLGINNEVIRLNTTWTIDQPDKLQTIRLGDSSTSIGTWGHSVLFGGLQYASNFDLQPGYISFPLPGMQGVATVPSTVDLYVNNNLISRNNVQNGLFGIDAIPTVTGQGEIRMVVKDVLGREQVVNLPYYTVPTLLKPQLRSFSYEIGFIRQNYGQDNFNYKQLVATGTERRGITETLTREWHAELQSDLQVAGGGFNFLKLPFGIFNIASAISHSVDNKFGGLVQFSLNHQGQKYNLGINTQATSPSFKLLGMSEEQQMPALQNQVFLGFPFYNSSLGLSYTQQKNRAIADQSLVSASYSKTLFKDWTVSLSATSNVGGDTSNKMVYLNLSKSFANKINMNTSYMLSNGQASKQLQFSHSASKTLGYSYNVYTALLPTPSAGANLRLQNNVGSYQAQVQHSNDQTTYNFSTQGGLVLWDKQFFFSRPITNSYGIVHIPDFENIGIYADNQLVAKTNRKGYALIPNLRPYERNTIRINSNAMPLDAQFDYDTAQAAPYFRSGVLFKFPAKTIQGVTLYLKLPDGSPVPDGALITVKGQEEEFIVAFEGYSFVSGITENSVLEVNWGLQRCIAQINEIKPGELLPDLGDIICTPVSANSPPITEANNG